MRYGEAMRRLALIWLGAAMIIDGLDGPLARRFEVAKHTPHIDGAILDHVIDFTGYCFLPALMIYHFELVPAGFAIIATSFLLMTSLYTFANRDAKTKENDFRGFPALWNIVVFYMLVFESGQGLNLAAIAFFRCDDFRPDAVYSSGSCCCFAPPNHCVAGRSGRLWFSLISASGARHCRRL
jgi:phosphatidylcholine synthase